VGQGNFDILPKLMGHVYIDVMVTNGHWEEFAKSPTSNGKNPGKLLTCKL
jgi:hypothetical protein